MAREAFITKNFRESSLRVIRHAVAIIDEYVARGYRLTLRQLYYQFVARDLLPNRQREYKRLGSIINDARLAGLIDWDAIEDRTRNVRRHAAWDSPRSIIGAVAEQYREHLWESQTYRPEVWIEKDALVGVIEAVCHRHRVPFFACRGYPSQSEVYDAGVRFRVLLEEGVEPVVLHLGDHDPSGIDMTRDISDRLKMFCGEPIEVKRLALNQDQVRRHQPPPNPAKASDSRFDDYQQRFGDESWELDALDPSLISSLIEAAVEELRDEDAWMAALASEEAHQSSLRTLSRRWDELAPQWEDDDVHT